MRKKEVVKVFTEDILPGILTKELWATSGSLSYKDGVIGVENFKEAGGR